MHIPSLDAHTTSNTYNIWKLFIVAMAIASIMKRHVQKFVHWKYQYSDAHNNYGNVETSFMDVSCLA